MVPCIPPELLGAILGNLSSGSDLARCCSTSKTFLSIARPPLYDEITLDLVEGSIHDLAGGWTTQNHLEPASFKLLDTLKSSLSLRRILQKVNFLGASARRLGILGEEYREVKLKELIDEIMDTFPRMELVHFDNLSHHDYLDEVVHLSQLRQVDLDPPSRLADSMVVLRDGGGDPATFRGAYERFQWIPYSTIAVGDTMDVESILGASQCTLKRLHIPLLSSSSLALFQNLERLCLRLSVQTPSNVVSGLSNALSDLPSLCTLLLLGSARKEDLGSLLTSGLLARSLPPSLAHLTLEFKLTPNNLLAFLRDLPATSNLKRFNCLGEMGETEEVKEEFSKRGIRLSLNDEWVI